MSQPSRRLKSLRAAAQGVSAALALGLYLVTNPFASAAIQDIAPAPIRAGESYLLPITPPLDQGDTDLCWVYATLSMLESNYLHKHPGSTISLSRGVLQRYSITDRFERQITGNSSHLEDGGLAVDALMLIRQNGLVAARDFHDVVDSDAVFAKFSQSLARIPGVDAKLKALDYGLARELGAVPRVGELDGKSLTPEEFAKDLLGDDVWTEYDVTRDGAPHVGLSDDPDARPETQVHYVELTTAVTLIHDSLARGQAVVWGSTDNHAMLIYGGDYDAEGRPLAYWIKDSFAPYTYRAAADEIHKVLTDVTTTGRPTPATQTVIKEN